MILSFDINPKYCLYHTGALVLDVIQHAGGKISVSELCRCFIENKKITIGLLAQSLDWLYLLGAIELEKDRILKCT